MSTLADAGVKVMTRTDCIGLSLPVMQGSYRFLELVSSSGFYSNVYKVSSISSPNVVYAVKVPLDSSSRWPGPSVAHKVLQSISAEREMLLRCECPWILRAYPDEDITFKDMILMDLGCCDVYEWHWQMMSHANVPRVCTEELCFEEFLTVEYRTTIGSPCWIQHPSAKLN